MKKILKLAFVAGSALCISLCSTNIAQAKDVNVTLPTFKVDLNGIVQNQSNIEYPFIVYNDITYFPMTYYDARLLGLTTAWDNSTGLSIKPQSFIPDSKTAQSNYKPYTTTTANKTSYKASIAQFNIKVNDKTIDNQTEQYPLLVFRDVTYFPLTWRFAVTEFGWKYTFDMTNGLKITPVPTKTFDEFAAVINGSIVNIRSQSNTDSDIVAKLNKGTEVTVIDSEKNSKDELWYKIKMSDNSTGYVASWLTVKAENYVPDSSSSSSTVTGEANTLSLLSSKFNTTEDILTYNIGSNTVNASQKNANNVTFNINNNTVPNNLHANLGTLSGALKGVSATQNGANATLSLTLADNAYCESYIENNILTLKVRYVDYNNTNLQGKTIVIDPGHNSISQYGTADPGATGTVLGLTEIPLSNGVTKYLKQLLQASGANVITTRTDEPKDFSLKDRSIIANSNNADLFVSIHGNSLPSDSSKSGAEVYYYSGSASLNPQGQSIIRKELADYITASLKEVTNRACTTKTSNFSVIRETYAPCVLVECGYLTNAEDELLLSTDAYQQKLAQGIYEGIVKYYNAK